PNSTTTFKFLADRSLRKNADEELKLQHDRTGTRADPERLTNFEWRFENQPGEKSRLAVSVYLKDIDVIAINSTLGRSVLLGDYQLWGVEPEFEWRTERTQISLSHNFTKLIDFDLLDSQTIQGISAEPYGFGNDLANWSNHLTKLLARFRPHPRLWASTSLRVYWGFPGAQDLVRFNNQVFEETGNSSQSIGLSDPGFEEGFGANAYLNAGLEFQAGPKLWLRFDAFNVLGWADPKLNKRNFLNRISEYRSEAPSIAIGFRFRID
ncbi:MAG: hypothetical protein V3T83_20430, partial [Acidobacteriota bacterium]